MSTTDFLREFVEEFEWTRSRHQGRVSLAAPIFDCHPSTLAQRLRRANKAGIPVAYVCDDKRKARHE